ncbi:hypothetical protein GCM10010217_07890 [Streptomyces tubercidicus]
MLASVEALADKGFLSGHLGGGRVRPAAADASGRPLRAAGPPARGGGERAPVGRELRPERAPLHVPARTDTAAPRAPWRAPAGRRQSGSWADSDFTSSAVNSRS